MLLKTDKSGQKEELSKVSAAGPDQAAATTTPPSSPEKKKKGGGNKFLRRPTVTPEIPGSALEDVVANRRRQTQVLHVRESILHEEKNDSTQVSYYFFAGNFFLFSFLFLNSLLLFIFIILGKLLLRLIFEWFFFFFFFLKDYNIICLSVLILTATWICP